MQTFFLIFILAFIATPTMAKPVGKASFLAVGEGLAIDIEAKDAPIDANVKKTGKDVTGSFSVTLADFKTGISLRDEHMCKALECGKFPKAVFVLNSFAMADGDVPFTGTLELHGVKKPFVGKATVKGSEVKASAKLLLTDFGITPPEYKLARVRNEVEVKVEIVL